MNAWAGIDVSKDTLDACLLREKGKPLSQVFTNDTEGFAKLLRWAKRQSGAGVSIHFCMESTGAYSIGIAVHLAEAEERVSVVNPYRIKHFGIAQGVLNKTDKVDAQVIAGFCRKMSPASWRMAAPEVRLLQALTRRLADLQGHLTGEQNRLHQPGLFPEIQASLRKSIRSIAAEMRRLWELIREHIGRHQQLKEDFELLNTINGIGEKTAVQFLAELPDVDQFSSAKSAAAFVGLNPREYKSGTSIQRQTRISKAGNARMRSALFMPALSASRLNPALKALYDRLIEAGLTPKQATCAVMRKLVMYAYGVLKSRRPFDLAIAMPNAA